MTLNKNNHISSNGSPHVHSGKTPLRWLTESFKRSLRVIYEYQNPRTPENLMPTCDAEWTPERYLEYGIGCLSGPKKTKVNCIPNCIPNLPLYNEPKDS